MDASVLSRATILWAHHLSANAVPRCVAAREICYVAAIPLGGYPAMTAPAGNAFGSTIGKSSVINVANSEP